MRALTRIARVQFSTALQSRYSRIARGIWVKLGTLKDGTRDGTLIVASRDLTQAVKADGIARTLMAAMENWAATEPRLQTLYADLNAGRAQGAFAFDAKKMMAPLPRAPQWLDASAFHSHGDLMEKIFNLDPPPQKRQIPLMYQGASDDFLGACDEAPTPSEEYGIDFEAEVGVIVDEVPMGTPAAEAIKHIKLLTLVNDVSLRVLAARDVKTGFGFLQSKPSSSFSPVAVTPDELGAAWRNGRVNLPVHVYWNGKEFGHPDASQMGFGFEQLVAHGALTRKLSAGTVIGSGTISNETYRTVGSACIAERRGIEKQDGSPTSTPYMKFGDTVRIEMFGADGQSIFGAIDQRMTQKTYS
jgi:fumarylacetoacetate (FAA) hydrolase